MLRIYIYKYQFDTLSEFRLLAVSLDFFHCHFHVQARFADALNYRFIERQKNTICSTLTSHNVNRCPIIISVRS